MGYINITVQLQGVSMKQTKKAIVKKAGTIPLTRHIPSFGQQSRILIGGRGLGEVGEDGEAMREQV